MSRIEPMSVEEIKEHLGLTLSLIPRGEGAEAIVNARLSLILAWAHERARVQMLSVQSSGGDFEASLNEVLDEINWPKDQRG